MCDILHVPPFPLCLAACKALPRGVHPWAQDSPQTSLVSPETWAELDLLSVHLRKTQTCLARCISKLKHFVFSNLNAAFMACQTHFSEQFISEG